MNLTELRALLIDHCIDSGDDEPDEKHCAYCASAVLLDKITQALCGEAISRREIAKAFELEHASALLASDESPGIATYQDGVADGLLAGWDIWLRAGGQDEPSL